MRSPGWVTLSVVYESPSGVPVQVDSVAAYVYSSTGALRQYLSPNHPHIVEISSPFYKYEVTNFDVTNPLLYPGFNVKVRWVINRPGSVSPATTEKNSVHWFVPTDPNPIKSNIITWSESTTDDLIGYYIENKLPAAGTFSFLAVVPFTTFIDQTVYESAYVSKNVSYKVTELLEHSPSGSPMLGDVLTSSVSRSTKEMCLVVGEISTITNSVEDVDFVRFLVHEKDAPINVGPTYFTRSREVKVTVNAAGRFIIPLVQGTIVVAEIPEIGYTKRFIVPEVAMINLSDISGEHVEMYRAP